MSLDRQRSAATTVRRERLRRITRCRSSPRASSASVSICRSSCPSVFAEPIRLRLDSDGPSPRSSTRDRTGDRIGHRDRHLDRPPRRWASESLSTCGAVPPPATVAPVRTVATNWLFSPEEHDRQLPPRGEVHRLVTAAPPPAAPSPQKTVAHSAGRAPWFATATPAPTAICEPTIAEAAISPTEGSLKSIDPRLAAHNPVAFAMISAEHTDPARSLRAPRRRASGSRSTISSSGARAAHAPTAAAS